MRLVAVALGLVCATQLVAAAPVAAQASDTEQLLEQFERALNTYDEDAVVQLFSSDGAVRDNHGGEVITQSQLRGWVRKARDTRLHAHLGDYTSSDGRTHFIIEVGQGEWYREGGTPVRASGSAEVRNGRILSLVLEPAGNATAGTRVLGRDTASNGPLVPLAIGSVTLIAFAGALMRMRARVPATARPGTGKLHSALGAWAAGRRRV